MSAKNDHAERRPITPFRTLLEEHIEDLASPGSCSCGFAKWDGTTEECRVAYRTHVHAYLCETLEAAVGLEGRVIALVEEMRRGRG